MRYQLAEYMHTGWQGDFVRTTKRPHCTVSSKFLGRFYDVSFPADRLIPEV